MFGDVQEVKPKVSFSGDNIQMGKKSISLNELKAELNGKEASEKNIKAVLTKKYGHGMKEDDFEWGNVPSQIKKRMEQAEEKKPAPSTPKKIEPKKEEPKEKPKEDTEAVRRKNAELLDGFDAPEVPKEEPAPERKAVVIPVVKPLEEGVKPEEKEKVTKELLQMQKKVGELASRVKKAPAELKQIDAQLKSYLELLKGTPTVSDLAEINQWKESQLAVLSKFERDLKKAKKEEKKKSEETTAQKEAKKTILDLETAIWNKDKESFLAAVEKFGNLEFNNIKYVLNKYPEDVACLSLLLLMFNGDHKALASFLENLNEKNLDQLIVLYNNLQIVSERLPYAHTSIKTSQLQPIREAATTIQNMLNKLHSDVLTEGVALYLLGPIVMGARVKEGREEYVTLYDIYAEKKTSGLQTFLHDYLSLCAKISLSMKTTLRGVHNFVDQDRRKLEYENILTEVRAFSSTYEKELFFRLMGSYDERLQRTFMKAEGEIPEGAKTISIAGETYILLDYSPIANSLLGRRAAFTDGLSSSSEDLSSVGLTTTQISDEVEELFNSLSESDAIQLDFLLRTMDSRNFSVKTRAMILHTVWMVQRYNPMLTESFISNAVIPILERTTTDSDTQVVFGVLGNHLESVVGDFGYATAEKTGYLLRVFEKIKANIGNIQFGFNRLELLSELSVERLFSEDLERLDYVVDHTGALKAMKNLLDIIPYRNAFIEHLTILGYFNYEMTQTLSSQIFNMYPKFDWRMNADKVYATMLSLLHPLERTPSGRDITVKALYSANDIVAVLHAAFLEVDAKYGSLRQTTFAGAGAEVRSIVHEAEEDAESTEYKGYGGFGVESVGPFGAILQAGGRVSGAGTKTTTTEKGKETEETSGGMSIEAVEQASNIGTGKFNLAYSTTTFKMDVDSEGDVPYVDALTNNRLEFFQEWAKQKQAYVLVAGRFTKEGVGEDKDMYGYLKIFLIDTKGNIVETHVVEKKEDMEQWSYLAARFNIAEARLSGAVTKRGTLEAGEFAEGTTMVGAFLGWDISSTSKAMRAAGREVSIAGIGRYLEDQRASYFPATGKAWEWGAGIGGSPFNDPAWAIGAIYTTYQPVEAEEAGKEWSEEGKGFLRTYVFYTKPHEKAKGYLGWLFAPSWAEEVPYLPRFGGVEYLSPEINILLKGGWNLEERVAYFLENEKTIWASINNFVDGIWLQKGLFGNEHRMMIKLVLLNLVVKEMLSEKDPVTGEPIPGEVSENSTWPFVVQTLQRFGGFYIGGSLQRSDTIRELQTAIDDIRRADMSEEAKAKRVNELMKRISASEDNWYIDFFTGADGKFSLVADVALEGNEFKRAEGTLLVRLTKSGWYIGSSGSLEIVEFGSGDTAEEKKVWSATAIFGKEGVVRFDLGGYMGEDVDGFLGRVIAQATKGLIGSAAYGYVDMEYMQAHQFEVILSYRVNNKTFFIGFNYATGETTPLSDEDVSKKVESKNAWVIPMGISWSTTKVGEKYNIVGEFGGIDGRSMGQLGFTREVPEGVSWGIYGGWGFPPNTQRPDLRNVSNFASVLNSQDYYGFIIKAFFELRKSYVE